MIFNFFFQKNKSEGSELTEPKTCEKKEEPKKKVSIR